MAEKKAGERPKLRYPIDADQRIPIGHRNEVVWTHFCWDVKDAAKETKPVFCALCHKSGNYPQDDEFWMSYASVNEPCIREIFMCFVC
jgi:hypothetical protein